MTPQEFKKRLEKFQSNISQAKSTTLPRAVGKVAQKHFQENFKKGGFVDDGLQPWTPSKRVARARNIDDRRPTLMSSRKNLYSSINYIPGDGRVLISNTVAYAAIHNNGGTVTQSFVPTPKQRRFAWANYFAETGIKKGMSKKKKAELNKNISENAKKWRGMALAKKINRTFTIPKRQFIGTSKELNEKIMEEIDKRIKTISEKQFSNS